MPQIQLKNFKGINLNEGLWSKGYAKYVRGLDIFGLQSTSSISFPGVLQGMTLMSAGSEAAATDNITDLIKSFAYFPEGADVWGLSAEATPRLYERVTGTWTLRRSGADAPALTSTAGGGGLAAFAGSLWVGSNASLFRQAGAYAGTWTNFGTFTDTSGPRPMKQLAGNLFIGDGRYVAKVDSTPTFTATALTLPQNFVIRSMEVFGDKLYIMADNGNFSKLFIWDGSASTFLTSFDFNESVAPVLVYSEGLFWAVSSSNTSSSNSVGTRVYTFNGYSFQLQGILPCAFSNDNYFGVVPFKGGILIASDNLSSTAVFEDGVAGIWMIGRPDINSPFTSILAFTFGNGVTQNQTGGIFISGSTIYVGSRNVSATAFEVYESDSTNHNTAGIYQTLPIDAGDVSQNKVFHGIRIDSETIGATATLYLSYRIDYATSFTTIVQLVSGGGNYYHIGRTGKVIELRFQLNAATGTRSTRLHSCSLDYSLTQ